MLILRFAYILFTRRTWIPALANSSPHRYAISFPHFSPHQHQPRWFLSAFTSGFDDFSDGSFGRLQLQRPMEFSFTIVIVGELESSKAFPSTCILSGYFTKKSIVLLYFFYISGSGFLQVSCASWVNRWGRILLRFMRCVSTIGIFLYLWDLDDWAK